MPSRPPNVSGSFATSNNEQSKDYIECTLLQTDRTRCRKRCFNEKKYRSMQEHIRRAHSEHYLPKLPATEESVRLMMNSKAHSPIPASSSSPQQPMSGWDDHLDGVVDGWTDGLEGHGPDNSSYATTSLFSPPDHYRRGSMIQTTNAAAALAQLHNSKPENEWHGHQDAFGDPDNEQDYMPNYFAHDGSQEVFPEYKHNADMGGPHMMNAAPERSYHGRAMSTPFGKRGNRHRKSSVTENARRGKHERDRSKDLQKRYSHDRKALSAEPNSRWNDLLDAAQSATEEESRDLTPIPQSPRSSMPPFHGGQSQSFQSYQTSPLQNTLLAPEVAEDDHKFRPPGLEPFPSVEATYDPNATNDQYPSHSHQSSGDSALSHPQMYPTYPDPRNHASSIGSNYHLPPEGLPSSPGQHSRSHTHDSNHINNAFARPHSSANNHSAPHFPHAINAAHFAQQQAAAQQQVSNYSQNQQPGSWLPHQQSYSASGSGASSGHSSTHPTVTSGHIQDFSTPAPVELYCANCGVVAALVNSYVCTECICGICPQCADLLKSDEGQTRRHGCPKCSSLDSRFKPLMLDLK